MSVDSSTLKQIVTNFFAASTSGVLLNRNLCFFLLLFSYSHFLALDVATIICSFLMFYQYIFCECFSLTCLSQTELFIWSLLRYINILVHNSDFFILPTNLATCYSLRLTKIGYTAGGIQNQEIERLVTFFFLFCYKIANRTVRNDR